MLILFHSLLLQQLFSLSDEKLEFYINGRRYFDELVGFDVVKVAKHF